MLTFNQSGTFHKSAYPGLSHITVTLKGGEGGTSSTGDPGPPPASTTVTLRAEDLPETVQVDVGRPGRGAPGQPAGKPGYVLVEIHTCGCANPARAG